MRCSLDLARPRRLLSQPTSMVSRSMRGRDRSCGSFSPRSPISAVIAMAPTGLRCCARCWPSSGQSSDPVVSCRCVCPAMNSRPGPASCRTPRRGSSTNWPSCLTSSSSCAADPMHPVRTVLMLTHRRDSTGSFAAPCTPPLDGRTRIALQGSIVDAGMAQAALDGGIADIVEMTRAQIADATLVGKVRAGSAAGVRPCILCNQACRVRDNRNPIVSCVADPKSGYESSECAPSFPIAVPRQVLVVGGGPAGLECSRILAERGHTVRLVESGARLGGALRAAACGGGRERMARLAVGWKPSAGVSVYGSRPVALSRPRTSRAAAIAR